jgi:enhancer of polycomb-like protein
VKLAKAIYPHWKERKIARKGQRIIPQLNVSHSSFDALIQSLTIPPEQYDESNDGDPFVCFRRRDVKPVRKTRRTDTASVDRMLKLKAELGQAKDLAERVLSREVKKLEVTKEARVVIDSRLKFLELKRKFPTLSNPADDELLIDRTIKRPKLEMTSVGYVSLIAFGGEWHAYFFRLGR